MYRVPYRRNRWWVTGDVVILCRKIVPLFQHIVVPYKIASIHEIFYKLTSLVVTFHNPGAMLPSLLCNLYRYTTGTRRIIFFTLPNSSDLDSIPLFLLAANFALLKLSSEISKIYRTYFTIDQTSWPSNICLRMCCRYRIFIQQHWQWVRYLYPEVIQEKKFVWRKLCR